MQKRNLTQSEKRDWVRLARTEHVGPVTFRQLLRRFNTIGDVLKALPEFAARGGSKKKFSIPSITEVEEEIAFTEHLGGTILTLVDPYYPESLAAIDDAPPVLSVRGSVSTINKRCIGIVGARNASLNGRKMAEILASELGREDFVIVSGLARGIDTSAHKASLTSGTIAVIAGGVDVVYPEENKKLYEEICDTGAVISDQPLHMQPIAQLFPRRNRLISGLSLGVIVVEAAKQSGSLITAHMALDQGREVFAVPGSPLDPRAQGCNDLIRQGAVLTESASDVLKHIHVPRFGLAEPPSPPLDPPSIPLNEVEIDAARLIIQENLGYSPVTVDELIRKCQFSASAVLTVLLELELAGRLERQPGQKVVLVA